MAYTPNTAFSLTQRALAPLRTPAALPKPANMNGAPVVEEAVLRDTLRHFGEYGLGAAGKALETAEAAFTRGDRATGHHWLEIGRALDRRGAARLERALSLV
ncbi:hypothetical protein [Altererythrobacter sp. GH1-8]|uniref:hypothetical protein n=1 Tax=Altererythrobacter sp. GH1-8 TaxID=3349333 RepID=UPI00374D168C